MKILLPLIGAMLATQGQAQTLESIFSRSCEDAIQLMIAAEQHPQEMSNDDREAVGFVVGYTMGVVDSAKGRGGAANLKAEYGPFIFEQACSDNPGLAVVFILQKVERIVNAY